MFRLIVAVSIFITCLFCGATGCNKKCAEKDRGIENSKVEENAIFAEIVNVINELCRENPDKGTECNHTVVFPAGTFSDYPVQATLLYADIELDNKENKFRPDKNVVTASLTLSFGNMSVILNGDNYNINLKVKENKFDFGFTLNLTDFENSVKIDNCFFKWNDVQVHNFNFISFADGPGDITNPLIDKFKIENLQEVLNSTSFINFINTEISVCNKESFLHNIMSALLLISAIKGFLSFFEKLLC